MKTKQIVFATGFLALFTIGYPVYAQSGAGSGKPGVFSLVALTLLTLLLFSIGLYLKSKADKIKEANDWEPQSPETEKEQYQQYLQNMDSQQIETYLEYRRRKKMKHTANQASSSFKTLLFLLLAILPSLTAFAQKSVPTKEGIFGEGGVIIILILVMIPILGGIALMMVKIKNVYRKFKNKKVIEEAAGLARYLDELPEDTVESALLKRKEELDFKLKNNELSGSVKAEDKKGVININTNATVPLVAVKKKAIKRPNIDPRLGKMVLWYVLTATFWLVFGTSVGEYLGIKFVSPDIDHESWLSFGRLRPVHTNSVFWGWASLGMLSLAYYVVPRVGNNKLYSYKLGWASLILINAAVFFGSIALMAGINNGGGEFREYIWPIMALFAVALILTLYNFIKTIAMRKTTEIYISNWYIVAAVIFIIVIALVGYIPNWQNGLGETIVQGYYMHQAVGMWFMMLTLGLVYYFLPQQLNKPIYSYSLGILAFWTQILFYTVIGSHHFVFSAIPWWLQTVAIIGSAGMVIPVAAGTTNFIMTFKGAWHKVASSYTLPFFIVGTIFYFTGSMQGTAEAFRSSNLFWHFTDFTVAHSHLTMYGIICFFVWGGMYAIIPRLTGKEPPQIAVGAHFWLALIGLLFYTFPLMWGGTLRGLSWIEGKPFIESVTLMAPYWLWRAIGGSLMWLSHLFFAYNLYKMFYKPEYVDVRDEALKKLEASEINTLSNVR